MNEINSRSPYQPLGRRLKDLRNKANENLAETSGAVEIDARELANFELGKSRPSEDVLLLLISHFGAKDDEAVGLWEMAGYGTETSEQHRGNTGLRSDKLGSLENRILFTDIVDITVNHYGVVMNFMQGEGNMGQSVARVGMSREHAKSVLKILNVTLSQTENKTLDSSKRSVQGSQPASKPPQQFGDAKR